GVDMASSTGKMVLRLELVNLEKPREALLEVDSYQGEVTQEEEPDEVDHQSDTQSWHCHGFSWGKGKGGKGKCKGGKGKFGWRGGWGHQGQDHPWWAWRAHRHWSNGEQTESCQQEHPWWAWHAQHWSCDEPAESVAAALSPQALASAVVCALPRILAKVREQAPEAIGQPLCAAWNFLPAVGEALQELWSLLGRNKLQKAEEHLARFLAEVTPSNAGHFLLSFFTELEALGFDEKLQLLATFFESQHDRLRKILQRLEDRLPFLPGLLVHHGVTCDGCGANPILGPRFKCQTCPDYDLCGACYARKTELHLGKCASHDFECKMSEATHRLHMKLMAHASKACGPLALVLSMFGQGQKGKGKAKGKGKCAAAEVVPEKSSSNPGTQASCATPGCNYQPTWHSEYCCKACKKGCGAHGPRCDKVSNEDSDRAAALNAKQDAKDHTSSEDSDSKTAPAQGKRCATEGCQYEATRGDHCCKACEKGKRCGHGQRCQHVIFKGEPVVMCKWEAAKPCVALPDSSEDSDSKAMDAKAKRCATEGCLYEATKGEYCCGACAKGKRCGHGRHCEHTLFKGNEPEIKKVACKPCAASGCNYQVTWHETHCCYACEAHGPSAHGPHCEKVEQ
ncbi:Sqstm1, partial [Symbiodinium pilosum]